MTGETYDNLWEEIERRRDKIAARGREILQRWDDGKRDREDWPRAMATLQAMLREWELVREGAEDARAEADRYSAVANVGGRPTRRTLLDLHEKMDRMIAGRRLKIRLEIAEHNEQQAVEQARTAWAQRKEAQANEQRLIDWLLWIAERGQVSDRVQAWIRAAVMDQLTVASLMIEEGVEDGPDPA
jgi:hypothetical protein